MMTLSQHVDSVTKKIGKIGTENVLLLSSH